MAVDLARQGYDTGQLYTHVRVCHHESCRNSGHTLSPVMTPVPTCSIRVGMVIAAGKTKEGTELHRRARGRRRHNSSKRREAGQCPFRNRNLSGRSGSLSYRKRVGFRSLCTALSTIADSRYGAIAIFRASRSIPGVCRELHEACCSGYVCWVVGDNKQSQADRERDGDANNKSHPLHYDSSNFFVRKKSTNHV